MKKLDDMLKVLILNSRCSWARIRIDVGDLQPDQLSNTMTGKHKIVIDHKGKLKVLYLSGPDKENLIKSMAAIDGKAIIERNEPVLFFDTFKITIKENDKRFKQLYQNLLTCSCKNIDNIQARAMIKDTLMLDNYTNVNCITRFEDKITVNLIKEVADRGIEDSWEAIAYANPISSKYKSNPLGNRPKLLQLETKCNYDIGKYKH